jgi:hypothetical protein
VSAGNTLGVDAETRPGILSRRSRDAIGSVAVPIVRSEGAGTRPMWPDRQLILRSARTGSVAEPAPQTFER